MNVSATAIADLAKALEAGTYDAAPSSLTAGAALQSEDLSPVMNDVTFTEKMSFDSGIGVTTVPLRNWRL